MHECGKWIGRMWRVTSLSLPSASIHGQSTACRCQIVRFPGHPLLFSTDSAIPVLVRTRTSRKRSLPTTLDGSVLETSWIEAQGRVAAPPGDDGRGQKVPHPVRPLTPSASFVGTSP